MHWNARCAICAGVKVPGLVGETLTVLPSLLTPGNVRLPAICSLLISSVADAPPERTRLPVLR